MIKVKLIAEEHGFNPTELEKIAWSSKYGASKSSGQLFIEDDKVDSLIQDYQESLLPPEEKKALQEKREAEQRALQEEIELKKLAIRQEENNRVEFAKSFNEFYEYDVASVVNKEHGLVDKEEIRHVIMEYAKQGWKLHSIYSNELGKNAIRILGFGVNSTACEDVMIFERRVQNL